jgi:hypothetical protein
LPVIFAIPAHDYLPTGVMPEGRLSRIARLGKRLEWQEATIRLSDLIPLGPLPVWTPEIDRSQFRDFLLQEAQPRYELLDSGINWRITLCIDPDSGLDYGMPIGLTLAEKQRWLMNLPFDPHLWNCLCAVLPVNTDADPAFAKLALDSDTWHQIIESNAALSTTERTKQLSAFHSYFPHVLNNALLHVLGALASNRFFEIGEYLEHPCLYGGYTHLMPHYLFAAKETGRRGDGSSTEKEGFGSLSCVRWVSGGSQCGFLPSTDSSALSPLALVTAHMVIRSIPIES